jgi:hypothetical protein
MAPWIAKAFRACYAFSMRRVAISQAGQYAGLATLLLAAIWILWTELRPPATAANQPRHGIAITAAPLAGAGSKIGPFRLTSAAVLTSPETSFGGLSGLAALPDGRLLAVTDAGDWLLFRPGAPSGEMGSISMPGDVKSDRDAEAIAFTPDGRTLISLEQQHRILGFAGHSPPLTPAGEPLYRPDTMGWPLNGGGESLAVLGDGRLIWIAENAATADGALTALLVAPAGLTRRIMIGAVDGFAPTDAVALDETHLLVLHRRFTGAETAAAISIVDLALVLAGGSAAPGRLLARWGRDGKWPVDNMEGIALVRRKTGPPIVYLVSDDNFSAAQRTLLLQLEIIAPLR